MTKQNFYRMLMQAVRRGPYAEAVMQGSPEYPDIKGAVTFFDVGEGVLVVADIDGLPAPSNPCETAVFGMHIHEGFECTAKNGDPFGGTGGHYNPGNCPHPQHAGDLPPLFGNEGSAWNAVLTDRFNMVDVIGRTVIIHRNPDDFTTQPSGNSGAKIACGTIRET